MTNFKDWLPIPDGTTEAAYTAQVEADVSSAVDYAQVDHRRGVRGLTVWSSRKLRIDDKYLFGGKRGVCGA